MKVGRLKDTLGHHVILRVPNRKGKCRGAGKALLAQLTFDVSTPPSASAFLPASFSFQSSALPCGESPWDARTLIVAWVWDSLDLRFVDAIRGTLGQGGAEATGACRNTTIPLRTVTAHPGRRSVGKSVLDLVAISDALVVFTAVVGSTVSNTPRLCEVFVVPIASSCLLAVPINHQDSFVRTTAEVRGSPAVPCAGLALFPLQDTLNNAKAIWLVPG